jgi:uncharacterized protein (UPF0332 family)
LTLDECFGERKLRKTRPDVLKAEKSLETAEKKLGEAEELAKAGFDDVALITAYASMFHSGRALLFRDGVIEKSHYCLALYLKEKYVKTGKIESEVITMMDAFREERHDVLYSLEGIKVKTSETKMAIETARKLLEAVRNLLK